MYHFDYFKADSNRDVVDFMHRYPFVTLIGQHENGLVATHVPVNVNETENGLVLEGHMMRKTDHHLAFQQNNDALVIFNGPNGYVSASWYTEMSASTWNYMAVHARGKLTFLDGENLVRVVRETNDRFESNPESPVRFDALPEEYVNRMMKAIVAFQIHVTEIDNVFKLSQNRDAESYQNIVRELKKRGGESALVAEEMENRLNR